MDVANALLLNGISYSATGVTGVGDMNGDGLDDFVVGASEESSGEWNPSKNASWPITRAGEAFLLFGRNESNPWPNPFELSALNGTNGAVISGVVENNGVGFAWRVWEM